MIEIGLIIPPEQTRSVPYAINVFGSNGATIKWLADGTAQDSRPCRAAVVAGGARQVGNGLEDHRRNPTKNDQRDIVMHEGGNHAIPDMVMLTVGIEAGSGAQSGVGSGRAGIA